MLDSNISSELSVAAGEYLKEGEYWLRKLSGNLVKTSFFYDHAKTKNMAEASMQSIKLKLSHQLQARLMEVSKGFDHTLHMILVASVVILLNKYTGNKDVVVGTPIYKQDIEGEFVNRVLALRNYIDNHMTFKDLLFQVRQTIVEAYENQNYPIETLLYHLNLPLTKQDFPLFDVVVLLDHVHDKSYTEYIQPNMIFSFRRTDEVVKGVLEFNALQYQVSSVERISAHFTALLQEALFNVESKISDLNILSAQEEKQQLKDFNNTRVTYPADQTIHEIIENQASREPHKAVVLGPGNRQSLTYKQLEEKANQLAGYLYHRKNVQPGHRVGILMDNSIELVTGVLGILKSGAAYVPMEPGLPEERLKHIIHDASIGVVISLKKYIRTLNRLQWECTSFHTFLCLDSKDIHAEEEREKNELMDETLWDYVAETAVDEITGGGWNTSFTGKPFSKKEMDEYGDNILKKLIPILREDMRVLEIGCASGISMYRIAPRVGFYHGTDLSGKMIENNKERVKRENHRNIALSCLPAHRIDTIADKNFDLVILNSVVQSFHGHNYLRKVIAKAIDLLGQKGHLHIGDIMDQDGKEVMIRDLIEFKRVNKDKTLQTKTDFSNELFVSRGFFEDLSAEMPEICSVEFSKKIYTIENELTKYRYDTLITINKTGKKHKKREILKRKHKYQDDIRALANLEAKRVESRVTPHHPAYVIYTSGTTGTPKGVMIEHRSLVNYIGWAAKTYVGEEPAAFPLYSSISFDLTVTSIFLPLISGNTIAIYENDKYSLPIQQIIKEDRVDIVKATPSHLKLLQNENTGSNTRLKKFIVGGEELECLLAQNIYLGFSRRVEIYNEYGPTEATVGCMIYKFNYEQEQGRTVSIGLPIDNVTIYILDTSLNPVPINGVGELCIGGDALARGYVNQVELTAEKFVNISSLFEGTRGLAPLLYRTGDLARRLFDGNIQFLGRIDEQVKIRGYRIELKEIQCQLLTHSDIKEAVVIAREISRAGKNRIVEETGDKFLCAYFVPDQGKDVEIPGLIAHLSAGLPDYMIPSYFVPIERIPLTPNGKLDKRVLPEPKIEETGDAYTAPENKIQMKLVDIWADVLGVEKRFIGIDANFFELGGHSLKATILIAEIHKAFNVKVFLAEIFKTPTVRGISRYIMRAKKDPYTSIEPVEKKEYYALSSAQKRLYILQQMDPSSKAYNMLQSVFLGKRPDIRKLETVFSKLIQRHESFRTSFHMIDGQPMQRIHDEVQFAIQYNSTGLGEKCRDTPVQSTATEHKATSPWVFSNEQEIEARGIIKDFIRAFELSQAPLLRVYLLKIETEKYLLMVDMHHIISDGLSIDLIIKEFYDLSGNLEMPELPLQYKDYAQWQNNPKVREIIKKQEEYWLKEFDGNLPLLNLPKDYEFAREEFLENDFVIFEIENEMLEKLRMIEKAENVTMFMIVLTLCNILFHKLSGQEDIIIGTVAAGRNHPDLEHIIGMFVNTLAIRNYPKSNMSFRELLKEVGRRTLETFSNQDYPFEDLVDKVVKKRELGHHPLFDVLVNFLSRREEEVNVNLEEENSKGDWLNLKSNFDMSLLLSERKKNMLVVLNYSRNHFKKETIERFCEYFKGIISAVVKNQDILLEDITISSYLGVAKAVLVKEDEASFNF